MKKNFIFSAILFCFSISATSQNNIHYGLTFGGNITNINGKGIKDNYNAGYTAGAFARITLSKKWSLQPEVFYNQANAQKGSDFLALYNINGYQNANQQIKLGYISVPVLLCYKINKSLTVNAGPQYDQLISDNENLIQNNKVAFKWSSAGAVAGVQLSLQTVRFFANYELGITNINNIDSRYKWYSRQAYLGLNFTIL